MHTVNGTDEYSFLLRIKHGPPEEARNDYTVGFEFKDPSVNPTRCTLS